MRILLLIICLTVASCAPRDTAVVPIVDCSGLPCINVDVGGSAPLRLVVSFSSKSSFLKSSALVKLAPGERSRLSRDGSELPVVKVEHLSVGPLDIEQSFSVVSPDSKAGTSNVDFALANDGSISYLAFKNMVVTFDVPHKQFRVAEPSFMSPNCKVDCAPLIEVTSGDFAPMVIATRGFAIDGQPVTAIVDPEYKGAIAAIEPIPNVLEFEGQRSGETYKKDSLLSVKTASIAFKNMPLLSGAPLMRFSNAYGFSGPGYEVHIGMAVLSHRIFVLDFKNMIIRLLR